MKYTRAIGEEVYFISDCNLQKGKINSIYVGTNPTKYEVSSGGFFYNLIEEDFEKEEVEFGMSRFEIHKEICDSMTPLYTRKNNDYGDSFGKAFKKRGMISVIMRLEDKLSRLETLAMGVKQQVTDESIKDTLLDLANYSVMTLVEMELEEQELEKQKSQICKGE